MDVFIGIGGILCGVNYVARGGGTHRLNYYSTRTSRHDITQVFPLLHFHNSTDCLPGKGLTILGRTRRNHEENGRHPSDSAPCFLILQLISSSSYQSCCYTGASVVALKTFSSCSLATFSTVGGTGVSSRS